MNICIQILICLCPCLIAGLPSEPADGHHILNEAIKKYESAVSPCAALIMDSRNGRIIYMHNRSVVTEKRLSPGSLVKPLSALIFLEYADTLSFDKDAVTYCNGRFYPQSQAKLLKSDLAWFNLPKDENGTRYFKCSAPNGHGDVNLHASLTESCNAYYLTAASRHPGEFFRLFRGAFTPERGTGASLLKNSETVFSPDTARLTPFRLAASSIGEGGSILMSPLKIAQLYAGIFHGAFPVPFEAPFTSAQNSLSVNFSAENRTLVKQALADVVQSGTLKKIGAFPFVKILGGKTGTATIYGKLYETHGWNVICFKFKERDYILVSFVEKGSGAKKALALSSVILQNFATSFSDLE
jgi:cell division protein FtsI/penicillin-binding protein 2